MNIEINRLSEEEIIKNLPGRLKNLPVFVFDEIDSTNNEAKKMVINNGLTSGLLVADTQSNGRGRMGHTFFSPSMGIYMTYVFTPDSLENASLATTKAGVCIWESIKELYSVEPKIKWVNDIYLDGKKICGILAEAVTTGINKGSVVIGIGINFAWTDVPDEIADKAGFLPDNENVTRNILISSIIGKLASECENINDISYLKKYRSGSMLTGKDISYYENDTLKTAHVLDIDDDAGLVVKTQEGEITTLRNGEVFSLKELS